MLVIKPALPCVGPSSSPSLFLIPFNPIFVPNYLQPRLFCCLIHTQIPYLFFLEQRYFDTTFATRPQRIVQDSPRIPWITATTTNRVA